MLQEAAQRAPQALFAANEGHDLKALLKGHLTVLTCLKMADFSRYFIYFHIIS